MVQRVLTVLPLLVLALAGCGGDDKKSPTGGDAGATKTAAATESATAGKFKADDVAFTFDYPTGFKQVDEPSDGSVLATVTPTPGDVNNGLKIRKTSDKELPFESYASEIRSQFEDQLGTKVTQKTGRRGDLELGVLQWTNSYTKKDLGEEKRIDLASKSYFFTGGGKTWQLECLTSQDYFEQIAEACKQALGSIEF